MAVVVQPTVSFVDTAETELSTMQQVNNASQ